MRSAFIGVVAAMALGLGTGCAARHEATGVVMRVEPGVRSAAAPDVPASRAGGASPGEESATRLTISHDPIPGFMDAMVMAFPLRGVATPPALAPGDRVAFRLRVSREASWIDRLRLVSAARPDAGLARSPSRATLVPIGGAPPAITLTDQRGRAVSFDALRGQVVAMTFLYTRCPLPDYCPRLLSHFKEVQARFAPRLGRDLTLLTVTFDPTYDTVDILKLYAQAHGADVDGWHFLTGPLPAITQLCEAYGIEFWPDEGLLSHTLQTAVLDRDGRLAGTIEGKGYSGRQLGDLIDRVLAR